MKATSKILTGSTFLTWTTPLILLVSREPATLGLFPCKQKPQPRPLSAFQLRSEKQRRLCHSPSQHIHPEASSYHFLWKGLIVQRSVLSVVLRNVWLCQILPSFTLFFFPLLPTFYACISVLEGEKKLLIRKYLGDSPSYLLWPLESKKGSVVTLRRCRGHAKHEASQELFLECVRTRAKWRQTSLNPLT